jgi:photosynthetic reaction center cytochrome c subunit
MNEKSRAGMTCSGCVALAMASLVLLWVPTKLTARPKILQQAAAQEGSAAKQKTAAEMFKNIEILKDIPSDQLIPSMRYMTAALGVRCDYCHEAEHFDGDDKPTKQRARNMMQMMFAIDKENFDGRREVTCYTCHRGSAKPVSVPALSDSAAVAIGAPAIGAAATGAQEVKQGAPADSDDAARPASTEGAASLPSADDIFAKYVSAIGGTQAIAKNGTRVEKGTVEGPRGLHATIETYRKAPNKAFAVLHTSHGDVTEGVDGKIGWGQHANGEVAEESGDELARSKQWAAFYPGADFKHDYSRFQVRGTEKIDGHNVYVVMAWWPAGGADRICFDAQSGLLLRISHRIESPLGSLPLQTDFDDYRDVGGLKIPFKVRVSRMDGPTTYAWQQMDANVPVDDARFEKPAEKKAPERTAK